MMNPTGRGYGSPAKGPAAHESIAIDPWDIDWNQVWKERRARRTSPKRDTSFWDGRAASFLKGSAERQYADRFLAIMQPKNDWSVFDMGCGSGTIAVAVAPYVRSVTAVDFSGKMLDAVRVRCAALNIHNVTCILGRWEEDWEELGIGMNDVASRSLVADDLRESIRKLEGRALQKVFVSTVVGDGPFDRLLYDAIGRPLDLGPDYIYNYNLLYQMGILANVTFIKECRNRLYESHEDALQSMLWMLDTLKPGEEMKLKRHLDKHLVRQNGGWRLSYDRIVPWAVLWWEKEKQGFASLEEEDK
jgi:SAM-dependent methyltransferase